MAVIIWDLAPTIFPGFDYLRWYGLSWLLGIFLGYRIVHHIYKAEQIPTITLETLTSYVMFGAIIGARLGHILFYDPVHYWNHPVEILPFRLSPHFEFTGLAGLASHGGMLGAFVAVYLFKRKYQGDYLWLLDRLAIGGAALGGFIRLGNLMNSEIIGIPTDVPWAFVFANVDDIPRHPSQLYEALFYFGICLTTYLLWRSKMFKANQGFLFGISMVLIFLQRFFIEILKENQVSFEEDLLFNMGQTLSIPFILMGLGIIIWSLKNSKKVTAKH